jgi:hypothetical protein
MMIRWLVALSLVLAPAVPAFAQTGGNPFLDPNPYTRRPPQWNQDQPRQPETPEQARQRWEREDRERFRFEKPTPTHKPGFEPSRPQPPMPTPDRRSR